MTLIVKMLGAHCQLHATKAFIGPEFLLYCPYDQHQWVVTVLLCASIRTRARDKTDSADSPEATMVL